MALRIKYGRNADAANTDVRVVELFGDNDYPTGGYEILPADLGLSEIIAVVPISAPVPVKWDADNSKLIVLDPGQTEGADVAATVDTALTGTNNDLTFTAVDEGSAGNNISVEYLDPGAADATISVSVSGDPVVGACVISVSLATDGDSLITSTAAEVTTAIEGEAAADALITVANAGADDGTGVVTAMEALALADGTNAVSPMELADASDSLWGIPMTFLVIGVSN